MDKRQRLIGIFFVSICVHLTIIWPLPTPQVRLPASSKLLHVRLTQGAAPSGAVAEELSVANENIGDLAPPVSSQSKGAGVPSSAGRRRGQKRSIVSDLVSRGTAKEEESSPVLGDGVVHPQDFHAYKFALATAALELRPSSPKGSETVLQGTAIVQIHLAGGSKVPRVDLAGSSGAEFIDTLALRMVRKAVGRVATPPLSEGPRGVVRLSVVFEAESP